MKRFILLYLFLQSFFCVSASDAKNDIVHIPYTDSVSIDNNNRFFNLPCVDKDLLDSQTGLPLYVFSDRVDELLDVASVDILLLEAVEVKSNDLLTPLIKADTIGLFSFTWNLMNQKHNRELRVIVNPIYKSNEKIFYVKSFKIDITYRSATQSTLKSASGIYVDESVLSSGKWVKVSVEKSGIYQLDYSTLASWGFTDPKKVKVFGNGGGMLPRLNSDNRTSDLIENSVFDNGNSLLFYAKGVVDWNYNSSRDFYDHELNQYSGASFYYITENDAIRKSFVEQSDVNSAPVKSFSDYISYDYYERNYHNLLKSGKLWVGDAYLNKNTMFSTPDFNSNSIDGLKVSVGVVTRSDKPSHIEVDINKSTELDGLINCGSVDINNHVTNYALPYVGYFNSSVYNSNTEVGVEFIATSSNSSSWLDYVTINYSRNLIFREGFLEFRNPRALEIGNSIEFKMTGTANKDILVLDITNPITPVKLNAVKVLDTTKVVVLGDTMREFVVFDKNAKYATPSFVKQVESQNLHGVVQADYIIVTPLELLNEANELAAIHSVYNDINPLVVTTEQIYNEFSSGKQDPLAIRSFLRMLYLRSNGDVDKMPKYLLLYGDGSYDNIGVVAENKSKIITYQSDNSLHPTKSYVSDDIFGFLDDNEGVNELNDGLDIGIGRFAINDANEARVANAKVLAYLTQQDDTDWQTRISFLAQDTDYNLHQRDAENLAVDVRAHNPEFNINKIYTDAYKKETTSQFASFPSAEKAIHEALVTNGSLIFNYTGHGSITAIAYNFLTRDKVDNLNNINRLPLFVTATCEVSRFDNPEENSLGEHIFRNPLGGGIGLLSTTRVVFSSYNYNLNSNFYKNVFLKDKNGDQLRLGDVIRQTKNESLPSENKMNFTLLCDPGLRLNYPKHKAVITDVQNVKVSTSKDTLSGLSHGRITGEVFDNLGAIKTDYNGIATVTLYDKISKSLTLGNSGQQPFEYECYDNVLYKGKVDVTNGQFAAEFIVPRDIRYDYGKGKFSIYSTDDYGVNSFGSNEDVVIGNLESQIEEDDEGPLMDIYLNSYSFKNGGKTGVNPLLIARVFDKNSINTAGSGIGHDLMLTIDDNPLTSTVLNSFFEFESGSYQDGSLRYQLPKLSAGIHKLTLRSWDCYNNSTTKSLDFEVVEDGDLGVENIVLYPNPIRVSQVLKIFFNHDEPNSTLNIDMEIFTLDGLLVNQSKFVRIDHNGELPLIEWQPETSSGNYLGAGIYICRLNIISSTGQQSVFSKRFVVLR